MVARIIPFTAPYIFREKVEIKSYQVLVGRYSDGRQKFLRS